MMGANWTNDSVQTYDHFNDYATFEYKYSFIPRFCFSTKRLVWGLAVRGRRIITGPGTPIVEDRWYHRHEAIVMMMSMLGSK